MPMNAVLMVVFLVGAPLVMMVRLLLQHQLTLELREQGLHARGEVVRIRRSWTNGKHRIVEYVFPQPDGSEIRGEYKEHRNGLLSQRASEGDSLEVLYLPDNPHRHQRVGAEVGLFAVLTGVFGLVVFMSLAIIVMMNAPSKKAPAPRGPTPAGRLRTYDEPPPRGKPLPTGQQRQSGAY
ncbi:DUF3592 domain-containing protein [Corallococcus carmarthensis]|uniref:DUF3592 domain-containing protein n=1 Tax=Corallococcus carmarthensis TaxID=2316728 RepID=A0A3A8JLD6_9BACT|nr:DUF3592 domain-containing protein [Corallococcus carmarthensis]RKG93104.1 DUF3592 domain-containing protein [Corallococcus carmarthensis]